MKKHAPLIIALVLIAASIYYIESKKVHPSPSQTPAVTIPSPDLSASATPALSGAKIDKASLYPLAKEITTPDGFVNTDGKDIKIADYIGKKVILVDFWTYSCINCQRTVPYLEAWYEKYKDAGLVIIGIHTPEFEFEKDYDNVKAAVAKLGITFPVVLDNDYSTWNAYGNHYWPHKYLIDIHGYIVHDHIGEGDYDVEEKEIQDALKERKAVLGTSDVIPGGIVSPASAESIDTRSPETYFGATRNEYLGNGVPNLTGVKDFSIPDALMPNTLYLGGSWDIENEYAQSLSESAEVDYLYGAKNIYFVASADAPVYVEIIEDGKSLGIITIKDATLYTLSKHAEAGIHTIRLKVKGAGLRAFTFTFG